MPRWEQGCGPFHHVGLIDGTRCGCKFVIVECAKCLGLELLVCRERIAEVAGVSVLQLIDKAPLRRLESDARFDEHEYRLALPGLPVLLVRSRKPRWLRRSVPFAQQQDNNVGVSYGAKTSLLRRSWRCREILGPKHGVSQRLDRFRHRLPELLIFANE